MASRRNFLGPEGRQRPEVRYALRGRRVPYLPMPRTAPDSDSRGDEWLSNWLAIDGQPVPRMTGIWPYRSGIDQGAVFACDSTALNLARLWDLFSTWRSFDIECQPGCPTAPLLRGTALPRTIHNMALPRQLDGSVSSDQVSRLIDLAWPPLATPAYGAEPLTVVVRCQFTGPVECTGGEVSWLLK